MARYFLELSYNGTPYHGWQRQPNATAVQQVVEDALSILLRSNIDIVGAGRTDTGVHAKQLMAHFNYQDSLDPEDLRYKLNSILPLEIAVHDISAVHQGAHARFDATSRCYEYLVSLKKDPFRIKSAYYVKKSLEINLMNEAANLLLNYTNFKCFSKSKTDVKTYNCKITEAFWRQEEHILIFKITADRFLRNMVRAIVGTLLEIGENKLVLEDMNRIIKSEDRGEAGYSVPAHGLYLSEVKYPKSIYQR